MDGEDTECQARTCIASVCGLAFTPADTPVTDQILGNCHASFCDGAGGFVEAIDDADLPIDDNVCTDDVCAAGTPTNPPLPVAGRRAACSRRSSATGTAAFCCAVGHVYR